MKSIFILIFVVFAFISSTVGSTEYVTYNCDYFTVDCPANWIQSKSDVESINYIVDSELTHTLSLLFRLSGLAFPDIKANYLYTFHDRHDELNYFSVMSLQMNHIRYQGIMFGDDLITSEGTLNLVGQQMLKSLRFNSTGHNFPVQIIHDNDKPSEYVRYNTRHLIIDCPKDWETFSLDTNFAITVMNILRPIMSSEFDTTVPIIKPHFLYAFYDENQIENSFTITSLESNGGRYCGILFSSFMFRLDGTFDTRTQYIIDSIKLK